MATRLDLLTIMVNKMPTMLAFYRDVLGFAVKRDRGGWVSLENDGVRLALWERTALTTQFSQSRFRPPPRWTKPSPAWSPPAPRPCPPPPTPRNGTCARLGLEIRMGT